MAPEGRPILLPLLVLAVLAGVVLLVAPRQWMMVPVGIVWAVTGLTLIFFRDPVRVPPEDPRAVISPADGKIVAIQPLDYDEHIGGEALQISIFLSLFNVHTQRVPADALVEDVRGQPGRFLAAFKPRAGEENERAITFFAAKEGKFTVKQIAGTLARRIICYMRPRDSVSRGERLGYIRFGSRVEIIVPAGFQLQVERGDRVKGGTTVLGYFKT